jgi:serine/threonine-protein kinase
MLYEVVTGRRPFAGSSQIATLAAILHEAAVPATSVNPEVPAQVEKLLNKCLEKEPDRRYQSSEDLATDLRRLLRDLEPARQSAQARTELAPAVSQRPSIAVLPFQNMSTESAHSFFAGGLHDELLTQLAKVAGLKVISRTSVMGYKDTTKPLKVIGQELGVKTIVEGSVQVLGGRLRVNVQLIDAATDEHLWAERYDRTLDDAFAIQSDMAQQVVAAVGAALGADERREIAAAPTEDPEAYHLYIQGDSYRQRPGFQRQNFEVAQQLYERALARDPKFALAHAALSETHGHLYFQRFDPTAGRAARQREEAQKALCLAPDLPQAHAAMGRVYYWGEQDYGKALQEFEIALRGMPNDAELWNTIGAVHRRLGDWDAVRAAFDRAVQLNPRSADVLGALGGMTFTFLRQYSEALRAYDRSIALTSGWADSWAWDKAWALVLWKGDLDALKSFLAHVHTDEELGGLGTARRTRAELLLLERRAEALLELVRNAPDAAFRGQMFYTPTSLYSAWGHELRDDVGAAQTEYGAALDLLDSASGEFADDWRIHDARGLALAGLGRSHDALSEVQWLRGTHTYRFDAFSGPEIRARIALILVRAGESEGGLDEIERDLAGPGWLSAPLLRLDPRWDPVREHPRFKALLVKYADPEIPAAR